MELVLYILHAVYYGVPCIYVYGVVRNGVGLCGVRYQLRWGYRGGDPLGELVCTSIYTLACARTLTMELYSLLYLLYWI